MWEHAELAAAWSLNKALQSDKDFFGLCNAYANMLEIANHMHKKNFCIALEVHALRFCHRKRSSVEAQELKAVAMLYGCVFCSRYSLNLGLGSLLYLKLKKRITFF